MDRSRWEDLKEEVLQRVDVEDLCRKSLEKVHVERGELKALCPYHEEKQPSFYLNIDRKVFYCQGCGQKGNAIDLYMQIYGLPFKESLLRMADELGLDIENPSPSVPLPPREPTADPAPPPISPRKVDFFHTALRENLSAQKYLIAQRGLKRKTLKQYGIGWDGQRYTIPIRDEKGDIVNIRRYSQTKSTTGKMLNYVENVDGKIRRYGSPARLYGLDELCKANGQSKQVIVCEGEWDRLLLCQNGHLAVTGTHGAKTWRKEWSEHFAGKDVVLIFDTDRQGRSAAKDVSEALLPFAKSVKNIILPFEEKDANKDITDWYVKERRTDDELKKIISKAKPLKKPAVDDTELDFTMHRMTTYGSVPKRYLLEITPDKRERGIMEIDCDSLMRPTKFEKAFAESFNRFPIGMPASARQWREIVNKWLDESTVMAMPYEASDLGALREILLEKLEQMPIGESASDLERGMAIDTPEKKRVFRASHLLHSVALEMGDLGRNTVYASMRQLGCTAENIRIGNARYRVWTLPEEITNGQKREELFAGEPAIESGLSAEEPRHLN